MQLWRGDDSLRAESRVWWLAFKGATICKLKGHKPNVYGICVRCKDVA